MNKTKPTANRMTVAVANASHPTLRRSFIMTNRNGLHARPCALLIKALQPFTCEVTVEHDGAATNSRSILGLMCLAVGYESKVTFDMNGRDASQAMAVVQRLFDTQFEEAYTSENHPVVKQW